MIIKSEKELKALDNTLNHLKTRNINYRDRFVNKVRFSHYTSVAYKS